MTTSQTPIEKLKQQATVIVGHLKRAERREFVPELGPPHRQIETRSKPTIKVGIVMDDKIITMEIPWTYIAQYSEQSMVTWIVDYMRGERESKPQ